MAQKTEYWQAGPIEGIIPMLQPVAHALLQARFEAVEAVIDFPQSHLWEKPAGMASVGFHLQHIAGVIDRLFTYAKGDGLSEEQFAFLAKEGKEDEAVKLEHLVDSLTKQVDLAIEQLKNTSETELLTLREVGRKKIPSNTIGLLFHAAEHSQRHLGQLLVTVKVSGVLGVSGVN